MSLSINIREIVQQEIERALRKEIKLSEVTCPHCYHSYYEELYSACTLIAWAPIYKDGVLMNRNPNKTTTHCRCLNCGENFTYEE